MRLLIMLWGIGILLTQAGCIGEPLEEENFITTQIDSIRLGANFGEAIVHGQLKSSLPNDTDEDIVEYGVKWSRQVNTDESALVGSIQTKPFGGVFSPIFKVLIPDLDLDSTYFFQAYAQNKDGLTLLSRIVQFRLGVSLNIETHQQQNDTLLVRFSVNGLRNSGTISNLREFGVLLEEDKPGANKINHLLALDQARDGSFTVKIGSIQFNQKYLASLYVKSINKTWTSLKYNLKTTGGWRKLPDLNRPNFGSAAISMNGVSAFIGFGYPENCIPNGTTAISTFNSISNQWAFLPTDISFPPTYPVAWKINERIFCGFGEYTGSDFQCNPNIRCSLFEYNVTTNQFSRSSANTCQPGTPTPYTRSRAAAFTINGKAYIGLGIRSSDFLNDFWEFDPNGKEGEGSFRSIKALPVEGRSGLSKAGRQFPIVFQFADRVFVGGGSLNSIYLNDIWEFIPPKNDLDQGDWRFVGFFPGVPRDEMVCLTIGKKGYLLLGYHNTLGEQADVWEFDPYTSSAQPMWKKLPDFPGEGRASPIAFVVGDQFFIGGGRGTRKVGNKFAPSFLLDFWQFVPTQ